MKRYLILIAIFIYYFSFSQNYNFLGNSSLTESNPVSQYNAQYISSGYVTDLLVEKDVEVCITFVEEGIGYSNVLGLCQ
ncbi:hypothetical protein AR687_23065 [Flavobacteriaceae bacterium CRH]|uniref:hypothetical protein n=1 Tax=Flavobacterium pectinovorum TaxID=29533 RepID=UPI000740CCAA|nr:hypothetical protein [Flavobacterium pectinovorum]KUJ59425.1 hypothetical protein AR687_23065 [Flavobacteriaceae bacterium CRH]WKL49612.1 hypothetical protein Q1W71_07420 [Flavobacterium pectinovorum]